MHLFNDKNSDKKNTHEFCINKPESSNIKTKLSPIPENTLLISSPKNMSHSFIIQDKKTIPDIKDLSKSLPDFTNNNLYFPKTDNVKSLLTYQLESKENKNIQSDNLSDDSDFLSDELDSLDSLNNNEMRSTFIKEYDEKNNEKIEISNNSNNIITFNSVLQNISYHYKNVKTHKDKAVDTFNNLIELSKNGIHVDAALPHLKKQISDIDNKLNHFLDLIIDINNNFSNYSKNIIHLP